MTTKKRKQNKVRLSGCNTLATLNDLLRVVNSVLPEWQRLSAISTPADLYILKTRIENFKTAKTHELAPNNSSQTTEVVPLAVVQGLSIIATNAWRARNKMVDSGTGEAKEETKRIYRHIEAIFDVFKQIGLEIVDMQGRTYDAGMAVKVVSFEPMPGLFKEEITETIRPAIAWRGQIIQMGEVIVGTPQAKAERRPVDEQRDH